ncbi:MAG: hypothetical protein ABI444_07265 [Candidatus Kapaibacterium sp.]|jgi:hypothetical protein
MTSPQSWFDLPLMPPMDPRAIISFVQLDDNGGLPRNAQFQNSNSFNAPVTWAASPLSLSAGTGATLPQCVAVTPQDFEATQNAIQWIASHGVVRPNTQVAPSVQKIIFLKAGNAYITTFFLDWAGGVTSTDVQLSIRDNSATGGNFLNGAAGTVPAFTWSGNTFGGTSRKLSVCTTGPGRIAMGLRVIDNGGNVSMFEMDWNIVP